MHLLADGSQILAQGQAIHVRQIDVEQRQIETPLCHPRQGRAPVFRQGDTVA